jgi:hypothetical protein
VRRSDDDRILREMLAPNIEECLEALEFWLRRYPTLPVYRRSARAEARKMINYWQARSLADAPRAPASLIANAGSAISVGRQLVAYRWANLIRRGAVAGLLIVALITIAATR